MQDTFLFPIFNSNVVLRCVAYGGTYGGTLTLARNGAFQRKLSQVGGDLLPSSVQVPPESVLTFEAEYEPVAPSDAANDIVATATLVEDFLNETHTNATTFTSVRIKMCPRYCADGNNSSDRHVLGVDEYVNTIITPTGVSAEWMDDGIGGERYYEPGTEHYEIIGRMLMDGYKFKSSPEGVDITYGVTRGFNVGNATNDVQTGYFQNYWHVDNPVHN